MTNIKRKNKPSTEPFDDDIIDNHNMVLDDNISADKLFKKIFEDQSIVEDLLVNIVDEEWVHELDFNSLHALKTELIAHTNPLTKRIVDLAYEVKSKNELYFIIIIFEIQVRNEYFMAARINTYVALFIDYLINSKTIKPGEKIKIIIPFVFFDSTAVWKASCNLSELFIKPKGKFSSLKKYIPKLEYKLIDLALCNKAELIKKEGSLLSLMGLIELESDIEKNLNYYFKIVEILKDDKKRLSLFRQWFRIVVRRKGTNIKNEFLIQEEEIMITNKDKPQQEGIFKNFFEDLEEKGRLKGIAEGKAKGKAEGLAKGEAKGLAKGEAKGLAKGKAEGEAKGKAESLSILLKAKFGSIDSLILKKIAASTIEDLDRYIINSLTADKIDDVFKN